MPTSTSWFYLQQPTIPRLQACNILERKRFRRTVQNKLSPAAILKIKNIPQIQHQLQVVRIFSKEMAFTRRRDARSRVLAVVQRQPSMLSSVRERGSVRAQAARRSTACCHIQRRGEPSAPLLRLHQRRSRFPTQAWVGGLGVSCGEGLPEPASSQSSSC